MQKSDQIAAAIVLRGLAKDGKFAAADANEGAKVKNAVESAVQKVFTALTDIVSQAGKASLKIVSDSIQEEGKKLPLTGDAPSASKSK